MDELSLIVEGIINKANKLTVRNKQLHNRIVELQGQQQVLKQKLEEQLTINNNLNQRLGEVQVAKVLSTTDSLQARQKVNELLREVEKCYSLLNR